MYAVCQVKVARSHTGSDLYPVSHTYRSRQSFTVVDTHIPNTSGVPTGTDQGLIVTNLFTQGDLLTMTVTDTSCYVDIFYSTYDYLDISGLLAVPVPIGESKIFRHRHNNIGAYIIGA
jgi:hypothetical protein